LHIVINMRRDKLIKELVIPEGVTVTYENRTFTATGSRGVLSRMLAYPGVIIAISDVVTVSAENVSRDMKMHMGTIAAHIKNIMKGVSEGYVYKLKVCSGHFPMTVSLSGSKFEVKNYLGEKVPRVLKIKEGAKVVVAGNDITVEATNKELAGQVAADIELLVRITDKDRRIYQDGIYITDKAGKEI
jgi:large subunit ribosomal protein L6